MEAVGTWTAAQGGPVGREAYPPLHPDAAAATLRVIDAQYGGLLSSSASVLVVARQDYLDSSGHQVSSGTTVDVRLVRHEPHWRVTELRPGVLPAPTRPIPRAARAILEHPRLELPPAARADLASGGISPTVLEGMLALAERFRIGVSVVRCGHPALVYGTDRVSDHTRGRAFDTWRIDGHPVDR